MNNSIELQQVHDYYQSRYQTSEEQSLQCYLQSLHLDLETIEASLPLGIADRTFTTQLPHRKTAKGRKQRQQLQELGVLKPSGYETLTGLVLPLYNQEGRVVNLFSYSYRITSKKHQHFLNDYGSIKINGDSTAIIVDHILDLIALVGSGTSHTLIYSHDSNYSHLLEGITKAYVVVPKENVSLPQYLITLPKVNFFECVRLSKKPLSLDDFLANTPCINAVPTTVQEKPLFTELTSQSLTEKEDPASPTFTKQGSCYNVVFDDRHYRISGLEQNTSFESLRITLRASNEESSLYVDTFNIYNALERKTFIARVAEEFQCNEAVIKKDIGTLILLLEEEQQGRLSSLITSAEESTYTMSEEQRQEALNLLKHPDLLQNITQSYHNAGVFYDSHTILAAYFCATSRKLKTPLSTFIQSSNHRFTQNILQFFPPEQTVQYSTMTSQSLYYFGAGELKHNILSLQDTDSKLYPALKTLQSATPLRIASTGKNLQTGRIEAQDYQVSGPVAVMLTTNALETPQHSLQRCLTLNLEADHHHKSNTYYHSRTLEGIIAQETARTTQTLMQNVQRLIQPMRVINPFTSEVIQQSQQHKYDLDTFLTLVETITLLHQHQREITHHQTPEGHLLEILTTTQEDISIAQDILKAITPNHPELSPQSQALLEHIQILIQYKEQKEDKPTFTRKELCVLTGWSYRQIRTYLTHLQEYEYISLNRGKNGVCMQYQLLEEINTTTIDPELQASFSAFHQLSTPSEKLSNPYHSNDKSSFDTQLSTFSECTV